MSRDFLTTDDILEIHNALVEQYGGTAGIRDMSGLEAAVFRPQNGYYANIVEEACALFESILINHPFVDGNKRIGMYVMLTFLEVNGIRVDCTNADVIYAGLSVADGSMDYEGLLAWVREHSCR